MQLLQQLFEQWAGEACTECLALGANGSNRRYYRLCGATRRCIGTIGDDLRENEAFIAYTRHFMAKGIAVPRLYAVSDDHRRYLQQDLGDQSLYGLLLDKRRQGGGFDAEMLALYRQALADLAAIQQAGADLDFSVAYPRAAFDRQSILWDLNYFKYFFLKLSHIDFDEQRLEDDFHSLADFLLEADCNYFLYRDFNPRNIMVRSEVGERRAEFAGAVEFSNSEFRTPNSDLYYIDYQGGRSGAAQYDVASLLYSAKSDLPEPLRLELLNHYLDLRGLKGYDKRQWMSHFWGYVLVRILQTLGAYGYRGLYERKPYFIGSIPLALNNLRSLLESHPIPITLLPELNRALQSVVESGKWKVETQNSKFKIQNSKSKNLHSPLTVSVLSFSYKQGLPEDPSGNGGGFIFDCRALPNPGRYAEYKAITGRDRPVIEFLQKEPAVDQFLGHAKALVAQSIEKYLERRFTSLQVAFGCTGGQHRSVYCAEQLARWISETYTECHVNLLHREQDR